MGTAVGEKLEKANEARDDLDVALGVAPTSSDGSGAEGDASGMLALVVQPKQLLLQWPMVKRCW